MVARASMLGMVLGWPALLPCCRLVNGFAGELRTRILSLVPHARVVPTEGSIQSWQTVAEDIEQSPGVQSVAPYMEDTVLLQSRYRRQGSRITGIDLERQRTVSELHQRVIAGDLGQLAAQPFTLALGNSLARWGWSRATAWRWCCRRCR